MVFAEAAAATVLALALPLLVFTEGTAATVFAPALLPLVFAEAAAATVLARALPPLVFAEAAAAAIPALALPPVVFAELPLLSVWPCVPLCLSLFALRGSHCAAGRRWGRWHRRWCAKAARVRWACLR